MTEYQRELLDNLIAELFRPEERQRRKQINELIDENDALLGRATDGFNHLGVKYGRDGWHPMYTASLSTKLWPKMTRLMKFRKEVEFDKTMIRQFLSVLIQPCRFSQDIRDALPECLVGFQPYLAEMTRTREPAWHIKNNPRMMQQYRSILSKIETYCAMRLLY